MLQEFNISTDHRIRIAPESYQIKILSMHGCMHILFHCFLMTYLMQINCAQHILKYTFKLKLQISLCSVIFAS